MKPRAFYRNATAISLALAAMTTGAAAQDAAVNDTHYLGRIVLGYSEDGTPVYAGENISRLEGSAVTAQGGTATIDGQPMLGKGGDRCTFARPRRRQRAARGRRPS